MNCQRNWLYLESIFSAPDIQRQLPAEAKMFMTVDKSWKEIMRKVARLPNAMRAATQPGLLETFQNNNALLDQIQKCLEAYLESKCVVFPRWELQRIILLVVTPHTDWEKDLKDLIWIWTISHYNRIQWSYQNTPKTYRISALKTWKLVSHPFRSCTSKSPKYGVHPFSLVLHSLM